MEEEKFVSRRDIRNKRIGGVALFSSLIGIGFFGIWAFFDSGFNLFVCGAFIALIFFGFLEGYGWGISLWAEASEREKGIVVRDDGISIYGESFQWASVVDIYRNPDRNYITIVTTGPDGKKSSKDIRKFEEWGDGLILALEKRGLKIKEDCYQYSCQRCSEQIDGPGPYCDYCAEALREMGKLEDR